MENDFWALGFLFPQAVRSFPGNSHWNPWLRWSQSSNAPHLSGTICTQMTMTPDACFWGPLRVESLSLRTISGACCLTPTVSLKPTTSRSTRWEAGTELGKRIRKVRDPTEGRQMEWRSMMRQEMSWVNKLILSLPDHIHVQLVPSLQEKCLISPCCLATSIILTTRQPLCLILPTK